MDLLMAIAAVAKAAQNLAEAVNAIAKAVGKIMRRPSEQTFPVSDLRG
jgi:hypothetical protein